MVKDIDHSACSIVDISVEPSNSDALLEPCLSISRQNTKV